MSVLNDISALLQEIPVFAEMKPTQLKLIAYVASSVRFRAGDVVSAAGSMAEAVLIVEAGTLERRGMDPPSPFERGAVLGHVGILSNTPERHDIVATADAGVISIPRVKFEELLEKFPELRRALLHDFALKLARADP